MIARMIHNKEKRKETGKRMKEPCNKNGDTAISKCLKLQCVTFSPVDIRRMQIAAN